MVEGGADMASTWRSELQGRNGQEGGAKGTEGKITLKETESERQNDRIGSKRLQECMESREWESDACCCVHTKERKLGNSI
jgi:hypothetical protein